MLSGMLLGASCRCDACRSEKDSLTLVWPAYAESCVLYFWFCVTLLRNYVRHFMSSDSLSTLLTS